MEVTFTNTKKIEKEIMSFDKKTKKKIFSALENMESFPNTANCKKISGTIGDMPKPCFRIKINKIRILFTLDTPNKRLIIYKIVLRKDAY